MVIWIVVGDSVSTCYDWEALGTYTDPAMRGSAVLHHVKLVVKYLRCIRYDTVYRFSIERVCCSRTARAFSVFYKVGNHRCLLARKRGPAPSGVFVGEFEEVWRAPLCNISCWLWSRVCSCSGFVENHRERRGCGA